MEMDNMDYDTVLGEVKSSLRNYTDASIEKMEKEANIIYDLGLDSLDAIELCMNLEEIFKISIPDDYTDKFFAQKEDIVTGERRLSYPTLGEFAKYIHSLVKEKERVVR